MPKKSNKEKPLSISSSGISSSKLKQAASNGKHKPFDYGASGREYHPLSADVIKRTKIATASAAAAAAAAGPINHSNASIGTDAILMNNGVVSDAASFEMKSKRRKMETLMAMASSIAGLGHEMVMGIDDMTSLQDMPVPCIMEVEKVEYRETFMGRKPTIVFHYNKPDGTRCLARACVAEWVVEKPSPLQPHTVLAYFGKKAKDSAPNEYYHDIRRFEGAAADKVSARNAADVLRTTSKVDLERRLNISNLSAFPAGSVFCYDAISSTTTASGESVCAVSVVDATPGAVRHKRLVFLPHRYEKVARECCPGVIIYKGMKNSVSSKRPYHCLAILRPEDASEELHNRRATIDRYTADPVSANRGAR
jgi:hypothetical protein